MPVLHQPGEAAQKGEANQDTNLQRTLSAILDSSWERDPLHAPSENDSLPSSICELLGLNMPRGPIVGPGSPGSKAPVPLWSPTSPSPRSAQSDDPGHFGSAADMASPLKNRRAFDMFPNSGSAGSPVGGGSSSPSSQQSYQTAARAIRGSPPNRLYSVSSECSSPTLEQALLLSCGMGSRSISPADSDTSGVSSLDTSGVSSLDSGNLSDLMNSLTLNHGQPNLPVQQPGSLSSTIQQELNTLTNLHALQTLSNNPAQKYYQQPPHLQNPLTSNRGQPNLPVQQQGNLSSTIQQELNTLTNLHALQTLSNNPAQKYYPQLPHLQALSSLLQSYHQQQQPQQCQQSPYSAGQFGSAPASPISPDCKTWGNGSEGSGSEGSVSEGGVNGNVNMYVPPCMGPFDPNDPTLDRAARSHHRTSTSIGDTTCTWSGTLPPRNYDNPTFSVKVFLGGVPWDINEATLINAFKQFGTIRVDWPGKDLGVPQPKGYAYIIFECEKQVKAFLQACTKDYSNGTKNWFYKISSKRMKAKVVEVIPWTTSDTNYVKYPSQRLEPERTVFVGALHGMMNAQGLATIMDDLFKGVVYAGMDIDKYKYPTGAGRVTFDNHVSFLKAILTAFVVVETEKFTKKIQVDPYLEDSPCSVCNVQQGPYFCREMVCFRYFCRSCWHWRHALDASMHSHKHMSRDFKSANLGALLPQSRALVPQSRHLARHLARK